MSDERQIGYVMSEDGAVGVATVAGRVRVVIATGRAPVLTFLAPPAAALLAEQLTRAVRAAQSNAATEGVACDEPPRKSDWAETG